jgi:hypothetical protein
VSNLQQNADAFMIASQNELLTRTQRRAFELEDQNKQLTAERDELARKLAESERIIAMGGACQNCGDSDPFRVGKFGMSTPEEFKAKADSFFVERDRADAAEARVREVQAENERITHEAIRMAAHAPPTFEAEYVKLQAKLAAVMTAWSSAIRHDGAGNYSVTLNYNTLEQAEDAYKVLRAETVKES